MSIRKSIAQDRAKEAYELALKQNDTYQSHVQSVPTMIRTNGLGNTLLFMKTGDESWKCLYKQVGKWLTSQFDFLTSKDDILKDILAFEEVDSDTYLRAMTQETLALFNWLKRFAKDNE